MVTSIQAVDLAELSYRSASKVEQTAHALGYHDIDYFDVVKDNFEVQCFCMRRDTDVCCVFRGTEPAKVRDWIGNVDARLVESPFGEGRLHRGFSSEVELVWTKISQYLVHSPAERFNFVGHSKGGADANIAAVRSICNFPRNPTYCWTFGAPRCLSGRAARQLRNRVHCYRFVNYTDPITWFPRWWWGRFSHCDFFRHADYPIYFRPDDDRAHTPPPYSLVVSDAARELWQRAGRWSSLVSEFHAISNYRRQMVKFI